MDLPSVGGGLVGAGKLRGLVAGLSWNCSSSMLIFFYQPTLQILSSYKGGHIPILHHVVDLLTHLLGDLTALLHCHGGALS